MEPVKNLPPMERPREKLQYQGAEMLSDEELLAVLLGTGTPEFPLEQLCAALLGQYRLADLAQMDFQTLCGFRGIGPAKAATLLAVTEFGRRAQARRLLLEDDRSCYEYLLPLLDPAGQLQYMLLLASAGREVLAFCEAGSVLPEISWVTGLAVRAGAVRLLLARNGRRAFSTAESRYLGRLKTACGALGIICGELMCIGAAGFKTS